MRANRSAFVTTVSATARLGQLAAIATLLLASAGAAHAVTVITVNGNYSLAFSNIVGNQPGISYGLNHTSFTENLTVGTPTTPTNFFTTSPPGTCGSNCVNNTQSETITVTFNFTEAVSNATGHLTAAGTYVAKYSTPSLPCAADDVGSSQTDCVYWNTGAFINNNPVVDPVTFSNGDVLDVTLYFASDWAITPTISFKILQSSGGNQTSTPLPAALPLFATGLGALGLLGWRRKRKPVAGGPS
jgi:hypothetical protein